jgi:exosome complex component RRP40
LIEEVNNGHQYVDVIKKVTTYVPEVNQFAIGIIKNRIGETFIVDINAPHDGSLGALEFDGATKRNKPNLNPGDIVYTRVSEYSKFLGAKLSCLNSGYSVKNALG